MKAPTGRPCAFGGRDADDPRVGGRVARLTLVTAAGTSEPVTRATLLLRADAIVAVLTDARDEIARREPPLDEKVRDFLKVRGRAGQPCARCGATIRSAGVHGHDAEFCPECQPDEGATAIVDWRKLRSTTGA
ncbi:MAG: zinc finger domain-containing protein [Polyangiales bacterium]